jgi:hypothetical protein
MESLRWQLRQQRGHSTCLIHFCRPYINLQNKGKIYNQKNTLESRQTNRKNLSLQKESLTNAPKPFVSIIASAILLILITSIFFGPSFLITKFEGVTKILVQPNVDRLGITVAENRQPFFTEWESSFGPHIQEIALLFWLFFFGSILLLYTSLRNFQFRERAIITISYAFFLVAIIFSRYSESSVFNGTSPTSLAFYALGFVVLASALLSKALKLLAGSSLT